MNQHPTDKPLYIIALVPPEPLRSRLRQMQEEFRAHVGGEKVLTLPPHITLCAPFQCEQTEEFIARLEDAVRGRETFLIDLTRVERFPHHPTLYYAIDKTDALQKLHEDVLAVVKDFRVREFTSYYRQAKGRAGLLLRVYGSEYVLERFSPHLSLTRHDSDREKFAVFWEDGVSGDPESFIAEDVVILKQGLDGVWTEHQRVRF